MQIAKKLYALRRTSAKSSANAKSDKKSPHLSYRYYEGNLNLDELNDEQSSEHERTIASQPTMG